MCVRSRQQQHQDGPCLPLAVLTSVAGPGDRWDTARREKNKTAKIIFQPTAVLLLLIGNNRSVQAHCPPPHARASFLDKENFGSTQGWSVYTLLQDIYYSSCNKSNVLNFCQHGPRLGGREGWGQG